MLRIDQLYLTLLNNNISNIKWLSNCVDNSKGTNTFKTKRIYITGLIYEGIYNQVCLNCTWSEQGNLCVSSCKRLYGHSLLNMTGLSGLVRGVYSLERVPAHKKKLKWTSTICRSPLKISLTHWGRGKMAAIFQVTFSNGFSWIKMHELPLKFHWSFFLWVELTILQHWFR